MNESDALLILNATPGLGNRRIKVLLDHFSSPTEVLSLSESYLQALLPAEVAASTVEFPREKFLNDEYQLMAEHSVKALCMTDADYPALLKEIPDAPCVLYVKGHLGSDHKQALAIVGSRQASFYGISIAEKLAVQLSELGFVIVSGLARGIDTAAHQGALKAGGITWAVTGHGLAHRYPPQNEGLFEKISSQGAVLSEFPMGTLPLPFNFPRRNRIISGLSLGVIVAEAALKSGALITVDCALEQGREVFAVPGKIDNPGSRGVHHLIKQGAKLVTCTEDILEELNLKITRQNAKEEQGQPAAKTSPALNETESDILNLFTQEPVHFNELAQKCQQAVSRLSSILLELELKRAIKQLPGKFFIKVA